MTKRNEIVKKYEGAIRKFLTEMDGLDQENGTYAEIEIVNVEVTAMGDSMTRYARTIKLRALGLA